MKKINIKYLFILFTVLVFLLNLSLIAQSVQQFEINDGGTVQINSSGVYSNVISSTTANNTSTAILRIGGSAAISSTFTGSLSGYYGTVNLYNGSRFRLSPVSDYNSASKFTIGGASATATQTLEITSLTTINNGDISGSTNSIVLDKYGILDLSGLTGNLTVSRGSLVLNNSDDSYAPKIKFSLDNHRIILSNGTISSTNIDASTNFVFDMNNRSGSIGETLHILIAETNSLPSISGVPIPINPGNWINFEIEVVGSAPPYLIYFNAEYPSPPIVATTPVTAITLHSARAGGNVTDEGSATVTTRGLVFSGTSSPTLISHPGGTFTVNGEGSGTFTTTISELTPGTNYYLKAYATNFIGTSYGTELTFTTLEPASEVWVNSTNSNLTSNWDIDRFADVPTAIANSASSSTVNVSNVSASNINTDNNTFIIGAQDFTLTGTISGSGLIKAIGTGYLSMTPAQGVNKIYPLTDGTNNYTVIVNCGNSPSQPVKIKINDSKSVTGSLSSDFWDITGESNLNVTLTFRIPKSAITGGVFDSTKLFRYWNGTRYVPVPPSNVTISDQTTYYNITITGINAF